MNDAKMKRWGWGAIIGLIGVILVAGLVIAVSLSSPKPTADESVAIETAKTEDTKKDDSAAKKQAEEKKAADEKKKAEEQAAADAKAKAAAEAAGILKAIEDAVKRSQEAERKVAALKATITTLQENLDALKKEEEKLREELNRTLAEHKFSSDEEMVSYAVTEKEIAAAERL